MIEKGQGINITFPISASFGYRVARHKAIVLKTLVMTEGTCMRF